ncbi:hypothetical protein AZI86_02065 [Bdellovibrio bacteriovorus]|uniref:Uncharacterized protein n=1 Tax=Bdellovibrio bacteriovorus TaxID=959 RepID=A0A150WN22_BDEBC|nr:hypothetical protein [Bdellovibrio bacteriovorus]KYG65881.1 hypothetical protein AZI86_02065 [Bdellovibrio bacteriovorus]
MNNQRKITALIVAKLREGQDSLTDNIEQRLREVSSFPDRVQVQFIVSIFAKNPSETDWKVLFENIESLLLTTDEDQLEVIYQDVLETLSNLICNQVLAPHLVTSVIGPRSRKYIEDYDKLLGSKTPGF